MSLDQFKKKFNKILKNYVSQKINQAKKLIDNPNINQFIQYIDTFIFSWGKRIRPYCMRAIYKWLGGKNEKAILNFWITFELLHSMALIHDDIIDQAVKRHNTLTIHHYINKLLKTPNLHVAEWQAILIWDLLLSRVYELQHKKHDFPEKLLQKARQNVHNMIEEVTLWQMMDVYMMASWYTNPKMIDKKNMYKTASYTFIRPMLTWAILANANTKQKKLIIDLGKNVWLSFQVRDDLFDITFQDKTKHPFSDVQEWQQTYLTNYIYTRWTDKQKKLLESCMGKKLNKDQILILQKMFNDSWAINFCKKLIKKYSENAQSILGLIKFQDNDCKQCIWALINKIWNLDI